jgi:hypothetical protein
VIDALPPAIPDREILQDVQARPEGTAHYHHKRESIDAHLTIVFAALAVSRWIEHITGWTIKRFVRTAQGYRTIQIRLGEHLLTATDPCPTTYALKQIHTRSAAH